MSLDRRSFLRRSAIALAGGLLLGDEALVAFERLTHRKVFALGALQSRWPSGLLDVTTSTSVHGFLDVTTSTNVHGFRAIPAATWRKVNRDISAQVAVIAKEWVWVDV